MKALKGKLVIGSWRRRANERKRSAKRKSRCRKRWAAKKGGEKEKVGQRIRSSEAGKKVRREQGYWKEGQKRIKEQRKEKRKDGIFRKKEK